MKCFSRALILLLSLQSLLTQALDVKIPKLNNDRDRLIVQLIDLALSKQGVSAKFIEADEVVSDTRLAEDLRTGKIDVLWGGMSRDLEDSLQPVRVPLFKGIQGHRIFVISPSSQTGLSQVKNLSDLKQFMAGSGLGWGDTDIVQAAGLPIVTTAKGVNLWLMLEGGRLDYFPLAIHEQWSEITARPELNLTAEKNLLLVYPFAMYLYVSKENSKLYNLLYSGMNAAIDDGSYDKFLFSAPLFKDALIAADVSKRTVIRIANPYMHPATPVNEAKYWLDPKKLTIKDLKALSAPASPANLED